MSNVLVVSGAPGAGKSTVAARVARSRERAAHLSVDDFFHAVVAGAVMPAEPAADAQNHVVMEAAAQASAAYAGGGIDVVVDGVIGPWMLRHFAAACHAAAVPLHLVVLRPSRHVALARATARTGPRDLVDEAVIGTLWDQLSDLGRHEPHALDTSDDTVDDTVARLDALVASGAAQLRSSC